MEIFELPCNFGSNLKILANGNSVNSMNSNRGSQFTVGDLRSSSSHRGGCLRRRAGVEKLLGVISVCLDRVIKAGTPSPSLFLLSLFFFRRRRSSPSCPRRRHSASPSQPSLSQLRILPVNPVLQPLLPDCAKKRRSSSFFFTAGSAIVVCASPWPARYGLPLTLQSLASASSRCRGALYRVA